MIILLSNKLSKTNTKTIVNPVLYNADNENLGDEQLDSQKSVLNCDCRASNDKIPDGMDQLWQDRVGDSKFEFYTNTTYGVSISSSEAVCLNETIMKNTSNGGSSVVDPKYFFCMGLQYINCRFIRQCLSTIFNSYKRCMHGWSRFRYQ